MKLRPYQQEFVDSSIAALREHQRVLSCMATGGGKTIVASDIMTRARGCCLFLADAVELIKQNADKFTRYSGQVATVEMADSHGDTSAKVCVATTQTMARRLGKWSHDHFSLVIVDEAHRNTLGAQAQEVLSHFSSAKVLGMTATPKRSDKRQLGDYYDFLACDIGLARLIKKNHKPSRYIKI